MTISLNKMYQYLLTILIIGVIIDTITTLYGLIIVGLQEVNIITLFFINIFGNSITGVVFAMLIKILIILILYTLLIIIKNTIQQIGLFMIRHFVYSWNISVLLILIIINYTTYSAVYNNLLLILL